VAFLYFRVLAYSAFTLATCCRTSSATSCRTCGQCERFQQHSLTQVQQQVQQLVAELVEQHVTSVWQCESTIIQREIVLVRLLRHRANETRIRDWSLDKYHNFDAVYSQANSMTLLLATELPYARCLLAWSEHNCLSWLLCSLPNNLRNGTS